MAGITRVTHQVRCRSKQNPQVYVDIEILDAIGLVKPNGDLVAFLVTPNVQAATLNPCIIDKTGDGNGKGDPAHCSRLSHMERFTSQSDPSQYLDLEILDAFALQPPDTDSGDGPGTINDEQTLDGFVDSGDVNSAQHAFVAPSTQAVPMIVDTVGFGLTQPFVTGKTTRGCHVNMATNAGDTDDQTQFSDNINDVIPPTAHQFIVTLKTDSMAFTTSNGNTVEIVAPAPHGSKLSSYDVQDATKYVTDPYTGEQHSPPDNTDPNVYAFFPDGSSGANLGVNPISQQTGKSGPVSQGIFWWIKKISGLPNPWFWYAPVQTFEAFSFFGSPPESVQPKWGYRGFQYFNYFPVIWILSENNPLHPMGDMGSPSLELCAEAGDWDTLGSIPTAPVGVGSGIFAPFGYLPVLDPPLATVGLNYQIAVPNIWELTGIPQPNLSNPNKPWDRTKNPYLWPSTALWEQAAKTFAANWQSVATGVNDAIAPLTGTPWPIGNPPPGWKWAVPWVYPHGPAGYPFATWGSFQNGIQPGLIGSDGTLNLPPEIFVPANVWTLNVDQLDPSKWDCRPSMVQDNPNIGGGSIHFGNPVLWSSEHH